MAPRTKHLMTSGPYRLCRNPMLVGIYIYNTGAPVWLWSVMPLLIVLAEVILRTLQVRNPRNEEIPSLIAENEADVMITEITEAPYYVQTDTRLAAPLLNAPFNHGEIGVLMQKGQEDLLQMVNATIRQMKADGSLRKLHEKYGLVYAFSTEL